jgi:hypothetical protein
MEEEHKQVEGAAPQAGPPTPTPPQPQSQPPQQSSSQPPVAELGAVAASHQTDAPQEVINPDSIPSEPVPAVGRHDPQKTDDKTVKLPVSTSMVPVLAIGILVVVLLIAIALYALTRGV